MLRPLALYHHLGVKFTKQLKTTPVLFTGGDFTLPWPRPSLWSSFSQSSLVLTKSSVCLAGGGGGAAVRGRAHQSWSCLDKYKMEMFDKK